MTQTGKKYRGRFAPSPTGRLHFGSLVAALGSYLDARRNYGEWLVRIEDLDPPREEPGAADEILRTLELFGFEWDASVLYQSRREDAYQNTLAYLKSREQAYDCGCSRREIADFGVQGVDGPCYPGTCRNGLLEGRKRRTLRVLTHQRPICFKDRIHGRVSQVVESACGDFVIKRADGLTAYQLAVVVDDAFQGVTHIVRGADLLNSTPRQIHLQQLLGEAVPDYAHLPLVLDDSGNKLSKQAMAQPVKSSDPLPTLLAAWAFLDQAIPCDTICSLSEFWYWGVQNWDIGRVKGNHT